MKYFAWGNQLTLNAAAEFYNRPILVYNMENKKCTYQVPQGYADIGGQMSDCPDVLIPNTIILLYDGGQHYESISHKNKTIEYIPITPQMIHKLKARLI